MRGTVKWFSSDKGYGFLTPEGGGRDVFVHHTSIKMSGFRSLTAGEKVEFELVDGKDGKKQAADVRRLEETPLI